jgi:peptide/nickel transport system substrate-binding protein
VHWQQTANGSNLARGISMDEKALRGLIAEVKDGKLTRRSFVQRMVALGLTAPMAAQMLTWSGLPASAATEEKFKYKPTKRGGGGALKVLWWQGATLLNPHFAIGTKDQDASRIFYEPLAGWDPDGDLFPVLAAEIPSRENGGLAADGKSVTWKLKRGVTWHDGKPFTADDVVFNWKYASDPASACVTIGSYKDVKVEKVDDYAVKVLFDKPTPFWADAFVGARGMIIPKHLYADFAGDKSRDAPVPTSSSTSSRVTSSAARSTPTTTSQTIRTLTPSSSRAAATPCRRRALSSRPVSSTSPGTCRSRTRSCSGWRRAARARR